MDDTALGDEIRLESASQLTRERIRSLIHAGALVPGQRLSLVDLSERFGVSKTPVRDALRDLSAEGLITIVPRVGVHVRLISSEEMMDVYAAKVALEPMMARRAASKGSAEQKARFTEGVAELMRAADEHDVDEYVRLLEERRALLLDMAASDVLRALFAVIDGRVRFLRYRNLSQPGQLQVSSGQHELIAKAIQAGDAEEAFEKMQLHMRDARERVRQLLEQSGPSFGVSADETHGPGTKRSAGMAGGQRLSCLVPTRTTE